ncbi:MAG TPA: efflux RND transporter periplasmic adaptor subunit [Gemmataceae bacterium]|nr:efflux RND transporter periplasmic adaptor subunit [Gemmataceae bacterium]
MLLVGNGKLFWGGLSGIALATIGIVGVFLLQPHWATSEQHSAVGTQVEMLNPLRPNGNNITVPSEVYRSLDIKTKAAQKPSRPHTLPGLAGRLALDNASMARIPPRFPGEIVAVGTVQGNEKKVGTPQSASAKQGDSEADRPLRYGDEVKAGQLLAVLWSKDLGEKKSEFIDALCRYKLDREQLDQLEVLWKQGAIPEQSLRDARTKVQADIVAVGKAERTLRSWRLTDADIEGLRKEAAAIETAAGKDRGEFERWARVEIRSPQDGVIVEMNMSLGSLISDTTTDLFKIADPKKLMVWAYVYEDDLPLLSKLFKKGSVPWTVRLPSQPGGKGFAGRLEQIGKMIDPQQHTAIVMGRVENADMELIAGQFVTVNIELPADEDEIEIPTTALVEDGRDSIVFVQIPGSPLDFERRKVVVSRRYHDVVYVRGSLRPGDLVMIKGALLLSDAMND